MSDLSDSEELEADDVAGCAVSGDHKALAKSKARSFATEKESQKYKALAKQGNVAVRKEPVAIERLRKRVIERGGTNGIHEVPILFFSCELDHQGFIPRKKH